MKISYPPNVPTPLMHAVSILPQSVISFPCASARTFPAPFQRLVSKKKDLFQKLSLLLPCGRTLRQRISLLLPLRQRLPLFACRQSTQSTGDPLRQRLLLGAASKEHWWRRRSIHRDGASVLRRRRTSSTPAIHALPSKEEATSAIHAPQVRR